eukprot:Rmarinus@m.5769
MNALGPEWVRPVQELNASSAQGQVSTPLVECFLDDPEDMVVARMDDESDCFLPEAYASSKRPRDTNEIGRHQRRRLFDSPSSEVQANEPAPIKAWGRVGKVALEENPRLIQRPHPPSPLRLSLPLPPSPLRVSLPEDRPLGCHMPTFQPFTLDDGPKARPGPGENLDCGKHPRDPSPVDTSGIPSHASDSSRGECPPRSVLLPKAAPAMSHPQGRSLLSSTRIHDEVVFPTQHVLPFSTHARPQRPSRPKCTTPCPAQLPPTLSHPTLFHPSHAQENVLPGRKWIRQTSHSVLCPRL